MAPGPRFSARLPWSSLENLLSRLVAARRAAGLPIIDLTQSNPTRVGLPYPADALRAALAPAGVEDYAPEPRGLAVARTAVAAATGHSADALVLTPSTSEAYSLLFKLFCDPGDVVVAPRPSYPLFDHLAAAEGVRLAHYPLLRDDGWRIDLDALASALASEPRARAVLLVNPGNPTGTTLERDQQARLDDLCARHQLALVSDEVFADYPFTDAARPTHVHAAARAARAALTFSLGGLSKSAGLPQLKLGWIAAGGPPAAVADALARLELLADTYLSVATPVMLAAPRLLELGAEIRAAILARVRANRATLAAALAAHPALALLPADAGWTAILRYPAIASDEDLAVRALAAGVLAHPGYFFDLDDGTYLVVSLLPDPAAFAAGIAILAALGDGVD